MTNYKHTCTLCTHNQMLSIYQFTSDVFPGGGSVNSFAFDAPTVWNAFPDEIRASTSITSFRKKLKSYLFNKAYPP